MKFWIDECLTPALVSLAHSHGYEATCTRDRGQLGTQDDELLAIAVSEEFVFVTNNHADFIDSAQTPSCTQDSSSCHNAHAMLNFRSSAMPPPTSSATLVRPTKRRATGC